MSSLGSTRPSLEGGVDLGDEGFDGDALLGHGVAVAEGDGAVFLQGVEVDGDAEGGADFVLTAVAAADGAGLVPEAVPALLEALEDGAGEVAEFGAVLDEGEDGDLDGGDGGGEVEDGADVFLALVVNEFLLFVGVAEEGQGHAVDTGGGLDDVGDVLAFEEFVDEGVGGFGGFAAALPFGHDLGAEGGLFVVGEFLDGELEGLVKDLHALAGVFLVAGEVEVGAGGDAFEFLRAEGEAVFDVDAGAGVVGEFVGLLPVFHEGVLGQAVGDEPEFALFHPVLVPAGPAPLGLGLGEVGGVGEGFDAAAEEFHRLVGLDEELELHLLELAGAEDVVAGGDLVAEGLADLNMRLKGRGSVITPPQVGQGRTSGSPAGVARRMKRARTSGTVLRVSKMASRCSGCCTV